jgi:hypothetical protein
VIPGIVFLVGMPRSGTKLFCDLIIPHPDLTIFFIESHFFPLFHERFWNYGDITRCEVFSVFFADTRQTIFLRGLTSSNSVTNINASTVK